MFSALASINLAVDTWGAELDVIGVQSSCISRISHYKVRNRGLNQLPISNSTQDRQTGSGKKPGCRHHPQVHLCGVCWSSQLIQCAKISFPEVESRDSSSVEQESLISRAWQRQGHEHLGRPFWKAESDKLFDYLTSPFEFICASHCRYPSICPPKIGLCAMRRFYPRCVMCWAEIPADHSFVWLSSTKSLGCCESGSSLSFSHILATAERGVQSKNESNHVIAISP